MSKDSRESEGGLKVTGGRRSGSNGTGAVLEEKVWRDPEFPKEASEVPNSPQPTEKEADRVGGAYSQQGFKRGVFSREKLPCSERRVPLSHGAETWD